MGHFGQVRDIGLIGNGLPNDDRKCMIGFGELFGGQHRPHGHHFGLGVGHLDTDGTAPGYGRNDAYALCTQAQSNIVFEIFDLRDADPGCRDDLVQGNCGPDRRLDLVDGDLVVRQGIHYAFLVAVELVLIDGDVGIAIILHQIESGHFEAPQVEFGVVVSDFFDQLFVCTYIELLLLLGLFYLDDQIIVSVCLFLFCRGLNNFGLLFRLLHFNRNIGSGSFFGFFIFLFCLLPFHDHILFLGIVAFRFAIPLCLFGCFSDLTQQCIQSNAQLGKRPAKMKRQEDHEQSIDQEVNPHRTELNGEEQVGIPSAHTAQGQKTGNAESGQGNSSPSQGVECVTYVPTQVRPAIQDRPAAQANKEIDGTKRGQAESSVDEGMCHSCSQLSKEIDHFVFGIEQF